MHLLFTKRTVYLVYTVACDLSVVSDNSYYTLWTLDTRQYDVSRVYILYKMDICINEFNVMRGRCDLIRWRFVTMYKSIIAIVCTVNIRCILTLAYPILIMVLSGPFLLYKTETFLFGVCIDRPTLHNIQQCC